MSRAKDWPYRVAEALAAGDADLAAALAEPFVAATAAQKRTAMSGGRGTSEHTCTSCGRTVTLTQQPDWGADYVCQDCKQFVDHVADHLREHVDVPVHVHRLYDARVEDQEQP